MKFDGKVAVIAGATGGLGEIVSQKFAEHGARLVLLGRSPDRLDALLDKLDLPKDRHLVSNVDLSQPEELGELVQAVQDKFGRIDILINLVGGWAGGEFLVDSAPDAVQTMLDQHLWTTYHLTQAFVPLIKNSPSGRVIVISSPTATKPAAKTGPYAVGKAAQEALMLTLAKELESSSATANVIQVKAIDTKTLRESDSSGKYASWTTPDEISEAILFLCSDQARQINGARVPIYR